MKNETRIVLKPALGITTEEAHNARARAWKFVFDRYREKAARTDDGEDEEKEINNDGCHDTPRMPH
jgi:hypothetical protein